MEREAKQTLVSLSLAGAIGYYLYNKLVKAGMFGAREQKLESAAQRTARELQMTEESLQPTLIEEPEIIEEVVEEIEAPTEELPAIEDETEIESAETPEVDMLLETPNLGDIELPMLDLDEPVEELKIEPIEEQVVGEETQEESEETPEEQPAICVSCGGKNIPGARFCEFCGTPFPADQIELTPIEPEPIEDILDDLKIEELDVDIAELDAPEELSADQLLDVMNKAEEENKAPVVEVPPVQDPVEELLEGEENPVKIMDNVEPLHKIDANDKSARDEFRSILDFRNSL